MKTLLFTGLLAATFGLANAQQTGQADQDRIQQEPPRPAQRQIENTNANNAKINAVKRQSEKDLEAEMRAKQKGQTQTVKTQPNSGVPSRLNDTLRPPQNKARNPQP